jgi:4'-phosphopantetheinyl transferase
MPGPLDPRLTDGAAHVWRADLTAVKGEVVELLCAEELDRAERFAKHSDGKRWSHARGILRALLGLYLRRDPSILRFTAGVHGKLELLEEGAGSAAAAEPARERAHKLSFNLSHSGELALYALTETGPVGVDVEVARRPINEAAIAARILGATEARRLETLDPATREREFLRAWTRHEATLKCRGTGIGDAPVNEGQLWTAELEVGPRAAAAVALEHPPSALTCWDWPPRGEPPD